MIDADRAMAFAREWIESWNAHDMERILSHYTENFEMSSPLIVERTGRANGRLKGRDEVRAYWEASLAATPPLRFEFLDVLVGVDSITIYYRNVGRRVVAETFFMDDSAKVTKAVSQWSLGTGNP
jgi:ketosteroid isomerase-like protein